MLKGPDCVENSDQFVMVDGINDRKQCQKQTWIPEQNLHKFEAFSQKDDVFRAVKKSLLYNSHIFAPFGQKIRSVRTIPVMLRMMQVYHRTMTVKCSVM